MKLLRNYGMMLAAALTIVMTSCGGGPIEHGAQYVLECPKDATPVDVVSVLRIMQERLNKFGIDGDYEISSDSNRITLRVRKGVVADDQKLRQLLLSTANLTFRSTYSIGEIAPTFDTIQKTFIRVNHFDSVTALTAGLYGYIAGSSQDYSSPVIAFFRPADTMAVMKILHHDSILPLLPSDVVFHWGKGQRMENGEETVALFACRVGRNYVMTGNNIESATSQMNDMSSAYEISLVFNSYGATEFARITKANVGRSVAIEVDDFIYSYPTVLAEITGGKAQISGNFSEQEAEDLANILNAGCYPVPVGLVEMTDF